MKRINLLYIVVVVLVVLLLRLNRHFGKQTLIFYGFAENKEMDISNDQPVRIDEILVHQGQKVNEGDVLAIVSQNELNQEFTKLTHEIAELETREEIWKSDIISDINRLKAQKIAKESEINSEIEQLKAEMAFNKTLVEDLRSVSLSNNSSIAKSSQELKIEAKQKELELSVKPLDIEIKRLEESLTSSGHPMRNQKNKLLDEVMFIEQAREQLSLRAPAKGVVGSINRKEGENVDAFSTILSFYNQKPTLVKAYVLESLILQISLDDTLTVTSTLHPEHSCKGTVIGLGSRIVEIPERLRKMPEHKTYGREILVAIPTDNHFLQKEKVVLNLTPPESSGGLNWFSPLFNFSSSRVESARK
jgi:multidrug resistance efflux pump